MKNTVTIVAGPLVWHGKSGQVIREEGEFTVVRVVDGIDPHGRPLPFDLRLPTCCTKVDKPIAQA